jgi:hypothetical protein
METTSHRMAAHPSAGTIDDATQIARAHRRRGAMPIAIAHELARRAIRMRMHVHGWRTGSGMDAKQKQRVTGPAALPDG